MNAHNDRRPAPARHPGPARRPAPVDPAPVRRPVHDSRPAAPDEPVITGRPVPAGQARRSRPVAHEPIALVDLLDRVLAGGVVITGEVRLAIADVDLVTVSLQALVASVSTALGVPPGDEDQAGE